MARDDLFRLPAGDTVQIMETRKALKKLGVCVNLELSTIVPQESVDLIHVFNLTRVQETHTQVCRARERGIPVVLSTIYWNHEVYLQREKPQMLPFWRRDMKLRREVLDQVQMLLPNGQGEYEQICKDFSKDFPYHVVPNGALLGLCEPREGRFSRYHGLEKFALMVARFSPRKNQFRLLQALQDFPHPVVCVGPVNDTAYFRRCRDIASPSTLFLTGHSVFRLMEAYKDASLHILPSYFETPGLATLEAAAHGCQVVSTSTGTAWEYLGDRAWYCDPQEVESIREAVFAAWENDVSPDLAPYVREHFSWQRAGEKTYMAYQEVSGRS